MELFSIRIQRTFKLASSVSIEQNGEAKKFFTNSEEMKNILQQISELPDGLPFETTIRTETFGKGRTKYVFS